MAEWVREIDEDGKPQNLHDDLSSLSALDSDRCAHTFRPYPPSPPSNHFQLVRALPPSEPVSTLYIPISPCFAQPIAMSKPDLFPKTSTAGITVDPKTLDRVVPESQRPDGSYVYPSP